MYLFFMMQKPIIRLLKAGDAGFYNIHIISQGDTYIGVALTNY